MKFVCILLVLCLHTFESSAKHLTSYHNDDNDISYRLPNNTKPEAYDLSLWTNVHTGNLTFGGEIKILLKAEEDTSNITIHYRELDILETKVMALGSTELEIPIEHTNYNAKTEFYEIFLTNPLTKGNQYWLNIKYQGQMKTTITEGIFRQSYLNSNGEVR